jgi:hypothetical protein
VGLRGRKGKEGRSTTKIPFQDRGRSMRFMAHHGDAVPEGIDTGDICSNQIAEVPPPAVGAALEEQVR